MNYLKDTLIHKMLNIKLRMDDLMKKDFAEIGITKENYISMRYIYENQGITQAELAEINHKDRNVIGKTIDRLEELGYVRRERGREDRRQFRLYITEKGEDIVTIYWGVLMHGQAELLKYLTDEEKETLMKLLTKMERTQ